MKALILNGAHELRDLAAAAEAALNAQLTRRGYDVSRHDLTALEIPECTGDLGCWTATPGVCVQAGPHRDIARDMIQSDLVAWLTPVTFGGYSATLKRQLDHCLPLISPRFVKVNGETHRARRYERFPSLLAIGLLDEPDAAAVRVFRRLVRRNVISLHARHFASPVLTRAALPAAAARAARWLDDVTASLPPSVERDAPLELGARRDLPPLPPRRALLLVGSSRGDASVSAAITLYLAGLLLERRVEVKTVAIHRQLFEDAELRGLTRAVSGADVVVLASPLYMDSLPAPVTEALQVVARTRRLARPSRPRFLAIINCGFPEAVHTDTGLAICRQWASAAGLDWIGGLGIGGAGMLEGKPIAELSGRARTLTQSLALAADSVARGLVVPEEALRLARTPSVPAWLYRFFGDWGFRQQAKRHGTLARLGERPYL
jgi:multimeric flavodoxin WrbA